MFAHPGEEVGDSMHDQDLAWVYCVIVGFWVFSARLHEHKAFTRMMSENLIKVRRSKAFMGKRWRWGQGGGRSGFFVLMTPWGAVCI